MSLPITSESSTVMSELDQTTREGVGQKAPNSTGHSKLDVSAKDESSRHPEERAPDTTAREDAVQGSSNSAEHSKLPVNAKDESSRGQDWGTPASVRPTASESNQSTNRTHAKDGGKASIVPQKLQEKLPESVERAVPNSIHDTGDTGGLHRKY